MRQRISTHCKWHPAACLSEECHSPKVVSAALAVASCPSPPNHNLNSPLVGLLLQLGWTSLYWASRNGQDEMVEMLLSEGAAVNATTNASPPPSLCKPSWHLPRGHCAMIINLTAPLAHPCAATSSSDKVAGAASTPISYSCHTLLRSNLLISCRKEAHFAAPGECTRG
jgi:ankyrin repeat protein